jgi:YcxB-like protein
MVVDTFEIRGRLTFSDLARIQYFNILRWVWPFLPVILICPPLTVLLFALGNESRQIAINMAPFSGLVLFWIVLPLLSAKAQLKSRPYFAEEIKYLCDADGVRLIAPSFATSMKWQIVRSVRETKGAFFIYSGPGTALVVPQRFFENEGEMVAWKEAVASWLAPKAIKPPGFLGKWF